MLLYTILGGDVLIFKGKDTLTIARGTLGRPVVIRVEVDGEDVDLLKGKHPFTYEEIEYFIKQYDKIVGPKY